jgi:GNAT superfamily N-acetyltransferase
MTKMNRIEQLTVHTNLETLARDLSSLLSDPQNEDISLDFPGSVARYNGEFTQVMKNLDDAVADCVPGKRQQFIAYSDTRAVGMSVIRLAHTVPEKINSSWPNVSLLICHPYRRQGIGRLSIEASLRAVDQHFGGVAWTEVRKANVASMQLVNSAGFQPVSETAQKVAYSYHA